MEIAASANKQEISDVEYRQQKIKQFITGSNYDSTSLEIVFSLAPHGFKYALISILNEKNQPNYAEVDKAKRKGYREVPTSRHPELEMNVLPAQALKIDCAVYKDCYIFEIEDFVLEARDKIELQQNKNLAERGRTGYNVNMGNGIKNDWDKTQINVDHGELDSFLKQTR